MPKLFPLSLQIEEIALGSVLRKLDAMPGVASIDLMLGNHAHQEINDDLSDHRSVVKPERPVLKTRKKKRSPKGFLVKASLEAIESGITNWASLRKYLETKGYTPSSVSGVVFRMKKENLIRSASRGGYEITQHGRNHLQEMKDDALSLSSFLRPRNTRGAVSNQLGFRRMMLEALNNQEMGLTSKQIIAADKARGGSGKSLGNTGIKMRKEELIEFSPRFGGPGVYLITQKGRDELARIKAEEEKQNG